MEEEEGQRRRVRARIVEEEDVEVQHDSEDQGVGQEGEDEDEEDFDVSETAQHRYLGELKSLDTREEGNRRLDTVEDLQEQTIVPVTYFSDLLPFPDEKVPLTLSVLALERLTEYMEPRNQIEVKHRNKRTFVPKWIGFMHHPQWNLGDFQAPVGAVGTLMRCEAVSFSPTSSDGSDSSEEGEEDSAERRDEGDEELTAMEPMRMLRLLTKGMCRFRITQVLEMTVLHVAAKVEFLPEVHPPILWNKDAKHNAVHTPSFVLRRFDALNLCKVAHQLSSRLWSSFQVGRTEQSLVLHSAPETHAEAVNFSYWLSRNLPVNKKIRQKLLESDSVTTRLLQLIRVLRSLQTNFVCAECSAVLTATSDIIAMSSDGSTGNYVNQHGFIHHLLTVKSVANVSLEGGPQTEHSYFPGYSWTIMRCNLCLAFLGWKFSAVKSRLEPKSFFALTLDSLASVSDETSQ